MEEELKVKPGDELLCTTHHYSGTRKSIVTVTKVTPTGRIRILESGAQFDKYGKHLTLGLNYQFQRRKIIKNCRKRK